MGRLQGVCWVFVIVLKLRISLSLICIFPRNAAKEGKKKKKVGTTFVLFRQENSTHFLLGSLNHDLISLFWCLQSEPGTIKVSPGLRRGAGNCSCIYQDAPMGCGALMLISISSSAEGPPQRELMTTRKETLALFAIYFFLTSYTRYNFRDWELNTVLVLFPF